MYSHSFEGKGQHFLPQIQCLSIQIFSPVYFHWLLKWDILKGAV